MAAVLILSCGIYASWGLISGLSSFFFLSSFVEALLTKVVYTDIPWLMMRLHQVTPSLSWKYQVEDTFSTPSPPNSSLAFLRGARTLTLASSWAQPSLDRQNRRSLLYNRAEYLMSSIEIVWRVKSRMVVWVQNGCKRIGPLPSWPRGWPGATACCPAQHHGRVYTAYQ